MLWDEGASTGSGDIFVGVSQCNDNGRINERYDGINVMWSNPSSDIFIGALRYVGNSIIDEGKLEFLEGAQLSLVQNLLGHCNILAMTESMEEML